MREPHGSEPATAARLEALAATGQRDAIADLDRYARLARRLIAAPVALVALIDGEHRHLRGVDVAPGRWSPPGRLALAGSFCEQIVSGGGALRVDDAGPAAPPSAPGEPRWAACLGIALTAPGGERVGALSVLDPHPHRWTDEDEAALRDIARSIEAELAAGFFRQRSESVETRDLSLRQRMEATLRERDEALTLAERSAGIGVWDVDLATGMARGTPQFFRIMGLEPSAEPVPLETFRALRDPHDRARVVVGFEEAVAGGNDSYEMEYRIRRGDGEIRWIFGRGRIVRDERGEPIRYFGVDIDITERKAAEAALAESEERLRLAQSAAGIGTWDWQLSTNEVRWSDDQWRLHGLPRTEGPMQLHEWRRAVHPDDRHIVIEAAAAATRTLTPYEAEYRVVPGDGRVRWMQTRGTVLLDETGAPSRMLGVTVDVTDRRVAAEALERSNQLLEARVRERTAALEAEAMRRIEAEARLHQAQKMEAVGRLTGGVAHDFNNLLTVIIGNLERLQRRLGDVATERAQLDRLAGNALLGAQRAASLTQHLLAFSRRQPLDAKPLDPNRLVRGMSNLLRRTIGETVTIESSLAPGLWAVCIDANQLEIAILNLAVNARDAMASGGRLAIETSNVRIGEEEARTQPDPGVGEYVAITVTDTGAGMTPEVAEHAFEPFFTTKEPGRGTGLGLSQVYGFVKQSGGSVRLDSAPGRGTSVRLLLPRFGDAAEIVAADERAEKRPPRANTETVLVVEDDARVREHSVATLTELGYRVLEAPDARRALDILEREPAVGLLFTDLGLPGGMNGGDLAEEARRRWPGLKVLCTTGYAPDAMLQAAPRAAIKLLPKPFSQEALAAKLREALDGGEELPPCILVVEDEALVRMLAVETLGELGFRTAEAGTAGEALERLRNGDGRIDAALIDIGLPDRKGDALAAELRASRPELPIVLASGYAEEDVRRAFGDDRRVAVLGKPYARAQLESALRALGVNAPR